VIKRHKKGLSGPKEWEIDNPEYYLELGAKK
jgi:hypothetical protein